MAKGINLKNHYLTGQSVYKHVQKSYNLNLMKVFFYSMISNIDDSLVVYSMVRNENYEQMGTLIGRANSFWQVGHSSFTDPLNFNYGYFES